MKRSTFFYRHGTQGFFRILGYGLWWAVRSKRKYIPFSERHGYTKVYRIGPFDVELLRPGR